MSEGGSSALGGPGSWSHDDIDDWMPRADVCSSSRECSERSQRAGVAESVLGPWKQFLTGWLYALVS